MKIFKVLVVALMAASVAWAQIPEENKPAVPCEHRGSFFSVGLGLSYMSLSKDEYIDKEQWTQEKIANFIRNNRDKYRIVNTRPIPFVG